MFLWPPCVADADIIFLSCSLFFLSSSSFSSPNLSRRRLDVYHTYLEYRSEMCCTRLTGNAGRKKSSSAHHRTTLSGYIFTTKAYIDNWKKNLLNSNISPTCPYNMNFGRLVAEIVPLVWGTPANFNGFRVLAALLHGTPAVSVSQTLRCWT